MGGGSTLIQTALDVTPWAVPGLIAALVLALLLDRPVAGAFRTNRLIAFGLVASFGAVLALTLLPAAAANHWTPAHTCAISPHSPLPLSGWSRLPDASERLLNVVLFIPLGFFVVLLRPRRAALWGAILVLLIPLGIEATQYLLPALHRTCAGQDVVDNVTGALAGIAAGLLVRGVVGLVGLITPSGRGPGRPTRGSGGSRQRVA